MSTKDSTEDRQQKNVMVLESTAEKLEKMALDRFGSKKKQGQVIDELVQNGSSDMLDMVSEIHSAVVGSRSDPGFSSHTQGSTPSTESVNEEKSPAEELEYLAHEQDYLVPSEHDLSVLKGAREVDKAAIILACMRSMDRRSWSKADIRDMIIKEVGLGYNSANQYAGEVVLRMYDSPVADMDKWAAETVDEIEEEYRTYAGLQMPVTTFRDKFGDAEGFAQLNSEPPAVGSAYYIDEEDMVRDLEALLGLLNGVFLKHNAGKRAMVRLFADEVLERLSDDYIEQINEQVADGSKSNYELLVESLEA